MPILRLALTALVAIVLLTAAAPAAPPSHPPQPQAAGTPLEGTLVALRANEVIVKTAAGKTLKLACAPGRMTMHGNVRPGARVTVWYYQDPSGIKWARRMHAH